VDNFPKLSNKINPPAGGADFLVTTSWTPHQFYLY